MWHYRTINSSLPMANCDWLLDANSSGYLSLGHTDRLAMSNQLRPAIGCQSYSGLRPQLCTRDASQSTLRSELANILASYVECLGLATPIQRLQQINMLWRRFWAGQAATSN